MKLSLTEDRLQLLSDKTDDYNEELFRPNMYPEDSELHITVSGVIELATQRRTYYLSIFPGSLELELSSVIY